MSNRKSTAPASKPLGAAALIALTSPITRSMPICLDGEKRAAYDQAQNASRQLEQALVQQERQVATLEQAVAEREQQARSRSAGGFLGTGDPDDEPLGGEPEGEAPDPDADLDAVRASLAAARKRLPAIREALAELIAREEAARAALVQSTVEVTVRSFPGGESARMEHLRQHCTGEPLIMWRGVPGTEDEKGKRQLEPIPAREGTDPAYAHNGWRVAFTERGEVARGVADMTEYRAEVLSLVMHEPKMTADEAAEWMAALDSPATIDALINLSTIATQETATVPFSRRTATTG